MDPRGLRTPLTNYYRPWIVYVQLATLVVPSIAGMLADGSRSSLVIAAGVIAYTYNVVEITRGLHKNAVNALLNDDRVRDQAYRFEAALTNMAQGLVMFDADEHMVVCNQTYLDMYGLSSDVVQPGITLLQIFEHSAEVGNHKSRAPEELHAALSRLFGKREPISFDHTLDDGRVFAVVHRPMPDGGWVATHEDITERRRGEARISHLAKHDALTGLPNRVEFRGALERALAKAPGEQVALRASRSRFSASISTGSRQLTTLSATLLAISCCGRSPYA